MKTLFTILFFISVLFSNAQSVSITSSASGAVCSGTNVIFTANATGFSNPYYQWYANGTAISGATSSTYSSTSLTNGDQVNVKVNEGPFGGEITSNGLLLNLDATNPLSYPGSGTTWNNLVTGNEVSNFTIQSAGTYSPDNGGVIRFGNTNSGAGASSSSGFSNLSAYTVEVWVKPAGTMGDLDPSLVTNYTPSFFAEIKHNSGTGNRVNMVLAYNARGLTPTSMNSYRYEAAINNGSWKYYQIPTDYSTDLNNWVQILCTYNGSTLTIYRNGVSLGTSSALGITSLRTPSIGYWIAHRWDQNDGVYGDYSKVMMYNRALTSTEVSANYTAFNARFLDNSVSSSSITTIVNASPLIPSITVIGDACVNKTSLSIPSGQSAYAWYKDDVVISGATSNTFTPTSSGSYKVQVTSGACSKTSTETTIYTCGRAADGKMSPITSSTPLVAISGEINSKYGIDERGLMLTKPFPVTANLILNLDATQSASYSGTGTTWTDISGQLNHATLMGSPLFESGSFTFAADKYALTSQKITTSMSSATFIAWVNPTTSKSQDNFAGIIFSRSSKGQASTNMGINFYSNNNFGYTWGNFNWNSTLVVPKGSWSMIAITISSTKAVAYLCNSTGTSSASVDALHNALSNLNFFIGNDPIFGTNLRAYDGKIATSMVYSNALTSTQITQIFDYQKAAFGL